MILIDYHGIAIGNIVTQKLDIEENLIRHMILNTIRMYRTKFKDKYGEIVIAADAGNNWRKEIFPNYKANRKIHRDKGTMDWNAIWEIINMVYSELETEMPYKCVKVNGCEADDVIASLVDYTNEFGNYEEVMICSGDKDFAQLQKYSNVSQYSTITKKFIKEDDPHGFLHEHILKGDGSDGVPNVLSPDDVFIRDDIRQNRLTKNKKAEWKLGADLRSVMSEDVYRNYLRNKKMIDLTETPPALKEEIINTYENQKLIPSSKVMNYFMKKKCKMMLEKLDEFL